MDIAEYLGGKTLKTFIGIVFIFYFLFSSSILLRNFCECLKIVYYPMTSLIFIILTFIIVICITLHHRFSSIAKRVPADKLGISDFLQLLTHFRLYHIT